MSNLGVYGESLASSILNDKGYEIVDRNYRYGHGEIDIIAVKDDILVFIEVKTRRNTQFGEPEEAITYSKQKQLRKIANAYLYEKNITDMDCRFDVVAILLEEGATPLINHIENAF